LRFGTEAEIRKGRPAVGQRILQTSPEEQAAFRELSERLDQLGAGDAANVEGGWEIVVRGDPMAVPSAALSIFSQVIRDLAAGRRVMLVQDGATMTTQETATMLNVSRPHLVKMLDEGIIPSHLVGTHRRVLMEDVLAYRSQRSKDRQDALGRIARLSLGDKGGYS
jgi:excisionase family DNA binding protein